MDTITVDTPNVNLREIASVVSIQIYPTSVFADLQIQSVDLGTLRVLGVRRPSPPAGPVGMAVFGGNIVDLPVPVQDAINVLANHFLSTPDIFAP